MVLRPSGSIIASRDVQSQKASAPIEAKPSSKEIFERFAHP